MITKVDEWISVEQELPPEDGNYFVTSNPKNLNSTGNCLYDGVGFIYDGVYRTVTHWGYPRKQEKRYGQVKQEKV